jgi:hypothetical protein
VLRSNILKDLSGENGLKRVLQRRILVGKNFSLENPKDYGSTYRNASGRSILIPQE